MCKLCWAIGLHIHLNDMFISKVRSDVVGDGDKVGDSFDLAWELMQCWLRQVGSNGDDQSTLRLVGYGCCPLQQRWLVQVRGFVSSSWWWPRIVCKG